MQKNLEELYYDFEISAIVLLFPQSFQIVIVGEKELVRRVEEFIDEEKTRICNKEEYVELLEDFEKAYSEGEVDDEVRESYDKFLKVR